MPLIEYYGLLFEWHDKKMELVYRGREITFDEVCSIFLDPALSSFDDVGHYDEQRLISVGLSNRGRLLTVVWADRGEVARIITAFEPSHYQKRRYSKVTWLSSQDNETKQHINEMVRHIMALKRA